MSYPIWMPPISRIAIIPCRSSLDGFHYTTSLPPRQAGSAYPQSRHELLNHPVTAYILLRTITESRLKQAVYTFLILLHSRLSSFILLYSLLFFSACKRTKQTRYRRMFFSKSAFQTFKTRVFTFLSLHLKVYSIDAKTEKIATFVNQKRLLWNN